MFNFRQRRPASSDSQLAGCHRAVFSRTCVVRALGHRLAPPVTTSYRHVRPYLLQESCTWSRTMKSELTRPADQPGVSWTTRNRPRMVGRDWRWHPVGSGRLRFPQQSSEGRLATLFWPPGGARNGGLRRSMPRYSRWRLHAIFERSVVVPGALYEFRIDPNGDGNADVRRRFDTYTAKSAPVLATPVRAGQVPTIGGEK